MVRDGHYPKFSAMIDEIEKIALSFINFESFIQEAKTQTKNN